jgi:hypothetical protein
MLELFKGQMTLEEIQYKLPYKEALLLRDVRIERLKAERDELDRERQAEANRQAREAARGKILAP